jgi:hypothetical protein
LTVPSVCSATSRAVTTSPDTDWMVTVSWAVVENPVTNAR